MFAAAVLSMHTLKQISTFEGIAHFAPIWKIEIRYMDGIIAATEWLTTHTVLLQIYKEFSLNIQYINEIMTFKSAKTYAKQKII